MDFQGAQPYIPQVDNFNAIEAFVRRVYNPNGDPSIDRSLTLQPYAYPVRFVDLTEGNTQTANIQIAANADFVLTSPRFLAVTAAGGLIEDPLVNILMTDSGSQEQLMSEAIPITTYLGDIQRAPYTMEYPRVIQGRSQLTVQVTNITDILTNGVDYKRLEVVLAGVLVRGFR